MLSEEHCQDDKKTAFEVYQNRIDKLEKSLERIIKECVPGVAGYHVIAKIAKEALNESR